MSGDEFTAARAGLVEHLRAHALRTGGPFTLRSGRTTSWYLDARHTTFEGRGSLLVARCVLEVLAPEVEAIGGMTMGADPVAVATALMGAAAGRPLRAFSVRKAPKDHGTGGRLVGPVRSGDRVAVVEDTTTTGGALLEAVDVVGEAGLEVRQAVALFDRSGGGVGRALAERDIPYVVLITPSDLGVEGAVSPS